MGPGREEWSERIATIECCEFGEWVVRDSRSGFDEVDENSVISAGCELGRSNGQLSSPAQGLDQIRYHCAHTHLDSLRQ